MIHKQPLTTVEESLIKDMSSYRSDSFFLKKLQHNNQIKNVDFNDIGGNHNDYGVGIRTMRLINQVIIDVEDLNRIESNEDEEEDIVNYGRIEKKQNEEMDDYDEDFDNLNIFKKRYNFKQFIDEKNSIQMPIISTIRLLVLFFLAIYALLGLFNFFLLDRQLSKTRDKYDLIYKSGRRESLIQILLLSLIQINQLKNDWLSISNDPEKKKAYFNKQVTYIDNYVEKLQKLQNELLIKGVIFDNPNLKQLMTSNFIDIYSLELGYLVKRQYDVNEATKQIISKILEIKNMPIENFAITSEKYYFLHFNMLNDYALAISAVTQNYIQILSQNSSVSLIILISVFIMSMAFMVIVLSIMLVSFNIITQRQNEILKIFFEIPMHQIKQVY